MGSTPQYPGDPGTSGAGAALKLQPHGATPPSESYISNNTQLLVNIWTDNPTATLTVAALILLSDGTISANVWTFAPTTNRAKNTFSQVLTEGFLLSLTAISKQSQGFANRLYCSVQMEWNAAGGLINQVLVAGQVSNQRTLTWPPGIQQDPTDGAGAIISVTGTTPAAGAEISETVPTNAIWRLKSFAFKLTSVVGGSNRQPQLIIDDGTNTLITSVSPTPLTPGQFCTYQTGDDAFTVAQTNAVQWLQMVSNIRLMPGYRIRTSTVNLGAGDQYTPPQYLVEQCLIQ